MQTTETRLQGAPNFRDIGGYRTANGRKVRTLRVFRSDGLHALTPSDFDALAGIGLRQVCDLRSEKERTKEPTVWPQHFVPKTVVMEVNTDVRAGGDSLYCLRKDPTERGAIELMLNAYRTVPGVLAKYIDTLFSSISNERDSPLVFHCSAGKDRTGMLSAIILLALGVPRETIYEDYLKTERYQDLSKRRASISDYLSSIYGTDPPPEDVLSALAGVREAYLDAALAAMGEHRGSIDDYLRGAGITESRIEQLRASLLE